MPWPMAATAVLSVLLIAAPARGAPGAAPLPLPPAPDGWEPFKITDKKKPTHYRLIDDAGRPVLHAVAAASASGLSRRADFPLAERPVVSWRWKVSRLVASADNSRARTEDAPASGPSRGPRPPKLRPPGLLELEELLSDYLETRVQVTMGPRHGKVQIDFATLEDLERIYRTMTEGNRVAAED